MSDRHFGAQLASLRKAHGLRQKDLVDQLGGGIARSTLANIESGRELPSARLMSLLDQHQPGWAAQLRDSFVQARSQPLPGSVPGPSSEPVLGGPFVIEQLTLVYLFRHARVPEELVEYRRVRAIRPGAASYGLKLKSQTSQLHVDEEVLFGGVIADSELAHAGATSIYLRRLDFGRSLSRGQRHEFAVRTWLERDSDPDTEIYFDLTIPAERVTLQANFYGPETPQHVWSYGPLADPALIPTRPGQGRPVQPATTGATVAHYTKPQTGMTYGIAWEWATT